MKLSEKIVGTGSFVISADDLIAEIQTLEQKAEAYDEIIATSDSEMLEKIDAWKEKARKYDDLVENESTEFFNHNELVTKARNWDLLEKLPPNHGIHHNEYSTSGVGTTWSCGKIENYESGLDGPSYLDTPAQALRAYYEARK